MWLSRSLLGGGFVGGGAPANASAIIQLTSDEQQAIGAVAKYQALSEREDGTNIG
jgi:hypothetical protein